MRSESNATDQAVPSANVESASEVVAALRAATVDRHREIDRSMPLSRPNPQLCDYVDHLRIMRAWLEPLERWLDAANLQLAIHPPRILQTSLIDIDLADAGDTEVHEATATSSWSGHTTEAYRWGVRYVVEGSRLGAAVLYRRLADTLRPHKLRYLQDGDGSPPGRWPQFLRDLRARVRTPTDIGEACKGACAGFDTLMAICSSERQRS